jgi:immunoglobulin-binding protein 1
MVQRLSLFSSNETVDDISTTDMRYDFFATIQDTVQISNAHSKFYRYLLIPAYLGSLTLLLAAPREESDMLSYRLKVLSVSRTHYKTYLSDLENYEILDEKDKDYVEAIIPLDPSQTRTRPSMDAQAARNEKIARFKRRKATENEIELLSQQLQNTMKNDETVDEEMDRKLVRALLDLFVQKTIDDLSVIGDEMKLLEPMVNGRVKEVDRSTKVDENSSLQLNGQSIDKKGLLDASGKVLRPFVITSKRDQIRKGVFRPHWNLPTMSVEEYLDLEMQRGNILSGGG